MIFLVVFKTFYAVAFSCGCSSLCRVTHFEVQFTAIARNIFYDILDIIHFVFFQFDNSTVVQRLEDFYRITWVFKTLLHFYLGFLPMSIVDISMYTSRCVKVQLLKHYCRNRLCIYKKLNGIDSILKTSGTMPINRADT